MFGTGVTVEDVLATRSEAGNPLRLPPLEDLAPYTIATAERPTEGAMVEVRLWMSERDAEAWLEKRAPRLLGAAVFSVLPPKKVA